jgi:subtilase family serine protease
MHLIGLLRRLRVPVVCCGLLLGLSPSWAAKMTPLLRLGSLESLATVTGTAAAPQYGLFKCQVGLSTGACYDPYQMRRAYQVDGLIGQAFDGTGQTIVIVDAFQHPNLVSQIAFFNNFLWLAGDRPDPDRA